MIIQHMRDSMTLNSCSEVKGYKVKKDTSLLAKGSH